MENCKTKSQDMPEWLLKNENYAPQSDKDTFLNKSILSLLRLISRIKTQDSRKSKEYEVNPGLKVAFTFILVTLLSLSRNYAFVLVINVYLLAVLSLMEARDIVKILKVSLVMTLFTFIVLLPAAFWGNGFSSILITSKVFATITAVNILSHSTRWNSMASAFKRFFVPDIFILVFDVTIKYIVMLGDFALDMFYALKLRSVGKNKSKYSSLSGIAGTMFLTSKEMAEDMYHAMECRGFTGEYHVYSRSKFKVADFAYIMINVAIIFTFIYLGRA